MAITTQCSCWSFFEKRSIISQHFVAASIHPFWKIRLDLFGKEFWEVTKPLILF
jgi:hypothetical protein